MGTNGQADLMGQVAAVSSFLGRPHLPLAEADGSTGPWGVGWLTMENAQQTTTPFSVFYICLDSGFGSVSVCYTHGGFRDPNNGRRTGGWGLGNS